MNKQQPPLPPRRSPRKPGGQSSQEVNLQEHPLTKEILPNKNNRINDQQEFQQEIKKYFKNAGGRSARSRNISSVFDKAFFAQRENEEAGVIEFKVGKSIINKLTLDCVECLMSYPRTMALLKEHPTIEGDVVSQFIQLEKNDNLSIVEFDPDDPFNEELRGSGLLDGDGDDDDELKDGARELSFLFVANQKYLFWLIRKIFFGCYELYFLVATKNYFS